MDRIGKTVVGVLAAVVVASASGAWALPIELRDQNGTRHNINTDVDPLPRNSNAMCSCPTTFSFQLKGDLESIFAECGLTDATVQDVPVLVPIAFTAGPGQYGADQPFTYKAKQGKSGTAKAS